MKGSKIKLHKFYIIQKYTKTVQKPFTKHIKQFHKSANLHKSINLHEKAQFYTKIDTFSHNERE